ALRDGQEVLRVTFRGDVELTTRMQLLVRECAHGLEASIVRRVIHQQQALINEARESGKNVGACIRTDSLHGIQIEGPAKDRQLTKQSLLRRVEQVVPRAQRCSQALMPQRGIARRSLWAARHAIQTAARSASFNASAVQMA